MALLDPILEKKRLEVEGLKKRFNPSDFRSFRNWEKSRNHFTDVMTKSKGLGIIAEIKKSSPSAGVIREDFDPGSIFNCYIDSGADAVSILTEKDFFGGSTSYIEELSIGSHVPILRKDFIVDPIQIYETRAIGADAVLLISDILEKSELEDLVSMATELNLNVLIEMHNREGLEKICGPRESVMLGINNRDLRTFETDISTSIKMADIFPENYIRISESGIRNENDIKRLKPLFDGVLVGEHFMKSSDPGAALAEFRKWCMDEN